MDAMQKKAVLDNYFMLLKEVVNENRLLDKSGQIYNVDQSGMSLDHCLPTLFGNKKKGNGKSIEMMINVLVTDK